MMRKKERARQGHVDKLTEIVHDANRYADKQVKKATDRNKGNVLTDRKALQYDRQANRLTDRENN